MEKSKKTLKMIGICIIGLVIVVAVNILKKPEDPFKNDDRVKLGYQHVEESDILNSKDYDSYYVYFYETGNEKNIQNSSQRRLCGAVCRSDGVSLDYPESRAGAPRDIGSVRRGHSH